MLGELDNILAELEGEVVPRWKTHILILNKIYEALSRLFCASIAINFNQKLLLSVIMTYDL